MPRKIKLQIAIAIDEKTLRARVVGWEKHPYRAKYFQDICKDELAQHLVNFSDQLDPEETSFRFVELEITRPASSTKPSEIQVLEVSLKTDWPDDGLD